MLFLVHSLRNHLCSVSALNRRWLSLPLSPLLISLSLSPCPLPIPEIFTFWWTILALAIFALGKSIIQIFIVSNTRNIFPSNVDLPLPPARIKKNWMPKKEFLNKFWLKKQWKCWRNKVRVIVVVAFLSFVVLGKPYF